MTSSLFPVLWSSVKVHSCTFTAGVATDFVLAPTDLISASQISRCVGSTLISISQVTKRPKIDRLAVVVWTKNRFLLENQLLAGLKFLSMPTASILEQTNLEMHPDAATSSPNCALSFVLRTAISRAPRPSPRPSLGPLAVTRQPSRSWHLSDNELSMRPRT